MTCIDSSTDNAAVKIYQITYFVAAPLSLLAYWALNAIWTPPGLGRLEMIPGPEDGEGMVVEGMEVASKGSREDEEAGKGMSSKVVVEG